MKELMIFTPKLELKGFVKVFGDFTFNEKLSDVGTFSFSVPYTKDNKDLLTLNSIVRVSDKVSGIITSRSLYLDTNKILISGKTPNWLLGNRYIDDSGYSAAHLEEVPISPISGIEEQVELYMRNYPGYSDTYSSKLKMYNFEIVPSSIEPVPYHDTDTIIKGNGENMLDFCRAYKTITGIDFNTWIDFEEKKIKFQFIERRPSDIIITDPLVINNRVYTESLDDLVNSVTERGQYFTDTSSSHQDAAVLGQANAPDGKTGMEVIQGYFEPNKETQKYIRSANQSRINFTYNTYTYNSSIYTDLDNARVGHEKEAVGYLHSGKKAYEFTLNVDKNYNIGDLIKVKDTDLSKGFSFLITGIEYILTGEKFSCLYEVESTFRGADPTSNFIHASKGTNDAGPWQESTDFHFANAVWEWKKNADGWTYYSTEYLVFTNIKSFDLNMRMYPTSSSKYYVCCYNLDEIESTINPDSTSTTGCKAQTTDANPIVTVHYEFPKNGEEHTIAVKLRSADLGASMSTSTYVAVTNIETW